MMILGINAYHADSAACLLDDGILVAAAEEERFRRLKHWAGFPSEAIRYCLREAGAALSDVAHVAINQASGANLWKKLAFAVRSRPDLGLVADRIRNRIERRGVRDELALLDGCGRFKGEVHQIEHHLAHLASAFFVSPFNEAAVVSVDGFGDFASAALGFGRGTDISIDAKVYFPNSLGIFYQALTQFIGFPSYGDEYKVMGLAPYGRPSFTREMQKIVALKEDGTFELDLAFFRHHREKFQYEWENGNPEVGALFSSALADLLGPARNSYEPLEQRHKDLARSVQARYEEALFHLLRSVHARHGVANLALAGGCAMNSVANGKIAANTPFEKIYVQAAAGDAGGAIGAAYAAWHQLGGGRTAHHDHAYWGPSFDNSAIENVLREGERELREQGCTVELVTDEKKLCGLTAEAIANGSVVGWFQGRMEWGPRALGNRSIVCDPRRADMKDILNRKIKRRESFRPFAPSVLREAVKDWFEIDDDVPFMMQVYQIRAERRELIPAVTHVDGSGRLQTVYEHTNARYYRLISAFHHLTNVPMVLNTSFNENEPVVCLPQEALNCFLRTKMDVLVMGDWVVRRSDDRQGGAAV